ncbi:MAG: sulfurtransferase [Gammaproteobacteria bacterium]|nr:sulfurtransferase [Gammaproteobacteria bacterium]
MSNSKNLCSPQQLQQNLGSAAIRVLDCSWYLPAQQIDAPQEYLARHIPGAAFFDIDKICDQQSDLPHMLPNADKFASQVEKLGINDDSEVVVYDTAGIFSAARVWWMFHVFGHTKVRVLNGGLPSWLDNGGEVSDKPVKIASAAGQRFTPQFDATMVATRNELLENCDTREKLILDARSGSRFLGLAPEPRPGLPSGHMPQSVSLPFDHLLDAGKLKPKVDLLSLFNDLGVREGTPVVTSCGSGVTAAIITLALAECGFGMQSLYDGAWAEWGSAPDTLILIDATL